MNFNLELKQNQNRKTQKNMKKKRSVILRVNLMGENKIIKYKFRRKKKHDSPILIEKKT